MTNIFFRVGVLILFFIPAASIAQCDCTHIIPLDPAVYLIDGKTFKSVDGRTGVRPGDKVCFASGTRPDVLIKNFHGTEDEPITITNMCNGKVIIKASPISGRLVYVGNSSFLRFTGSANPSIKYGIEITTGVQAIDFRDLSTNIEVDHLFIHDVGYSAINAKTDPTCDPATWRGNFTMRDIVIHDNRVENIGGEGIYVGESHYNSTFPVVCGGLLTQQLEHEVIGVQIFNNHFEDIGRDAIQVGGATSDCSIHDNSINGFGKTNEFGQQSGIQINPGTNAKVYNNIINTGTGFGIFAGGRGGSHFYNNIISDALQGGIIVADYEPVDPGGFIFSNNTIVNCKDFGIYMLSERTSQNLFVNNILVAGGTYMQPVYNYVKLNTTSIKWTEFNNIKINNIADLKFVDPTAKNFALLAGSPAIDAGKDMRAYIAFDFNGKLRPMGNAFDIGAFEYTPSSLISPKVNAGPDKTVVLPINTVTLSGSASDGDGSVASYLWTKLSGGNASLTNTNATTLKVSGLVAGIYTFRLTVTDNSGMKASDDVTVTVKSSSINSPPKSKAGSDKKINLPTKTATFYGSGTDTDGTISGFMWTKVSGGSATLTNANTSTLKVSGLLKGTYIFRLTVTDNSGATAKDDVKLIVNAPPVAKAGADKTVLLPASTITLSGSGSDSDGKIIGYLWLKIAGQAVTLTDATSPTVKISGLVAGTYKFRLRVKDNYGSTDTDDVIVTVSDNATTTMASTDKIAVVEEEFSFMNKIYPAGYTYTVALFNKGGAKVFQGRWSNELYDDLINTGELYIYQVIQDKRQIDSGKFIRKAD